MLPTLLISSINRTLPVSPGVVPSAGPKNVTKRWLNEDGKLPQLSSFHVQETPKLSGQRVSYCRCWQSATFPLCDGAHKEYNKATGDRLGPLRVYLPNFSPQSPDEPQEDEQK
eukprot:TRINITY_DN13573_c0_g1_i1.p1 TRINITY_DN13573_c0_g1~~TRINITY_DN13573_c0_g1_i1.p1  ORF type:complete len:121 (+),score=25.75 TRINITY_DN13573_c0_g1_i1:27-365(+)